MKVSVIIPVCNGLPYLKECLQSVRGQTLREIEILCVDDGSADGSGAYLAACAREDSRIVLLHTERLGAGPARNAGLAAAAGEFVAFLDADDYYASDRALEQLYLAAKRENVSVCGGKRRVLAGGRLQETDESDDDPPAGLHAYPDYQFDLHFHRFLFDAGMLKRSGVQFPPYLRYQDPVFLARVMTYAGQAYIIEDIVYIYRLHAQSKPWRDEQMFDYLAAVTDNLRFSAERRLKILHASSLSRLERDEFIRIVSHLNASPVPMHALLLKANSAVDTKLLGLPDGYLIKPLRNMVEQFGKYQRLKQSFGIRHLRAVRDWLRGNKRPDMESDDAK